MCSKLRAPVASGAKHQQLKNNRVRTRHWRTVFAPRYLNTMIERPVASMKLKNCIRAVIFEDNDGKTCGQHEAHSVLTMCSQSKDKHGA